MTRTIEATTYTAATKFLIGWLDEHIGLQSITAIGHRVVHGMHHTAPELVTQELLDELLRIVPCDPQHLPSEIDLIEAFRACIPKTPQVVCFDTGFHATMPRVAKLLSLPRRFDRKGVQRYGFHGLSYEYLIQELVRIGDAAAKHGSVILAHLGNGASLTAVRDGKSIDTSMGFTPAAGLPMSTRSGDLDPGLVGYLARTERMSVADFDQIINHESGLLGVSEISSDMRELIAKGSTDNRAAEAVELFCYQTKKWIGAFVAALGGLQTLVFTGGIGENCPSVRYRICEGLSCLGIEIDKASNDLGAEVISTMSSRVTIRVIRTNEEQMIAHAVHRLIGANSADS
jgi:acetate kinase